MVASMIQLIQALGKSLPHSMLHLSEEITENQTQSELEHLK